LKSIITNCFFISALSLTSPSPTTAQFDSPTFTATTTAFSIATGEGQSPAILNFSYSKRDKKIVLNWVADKNQSANQFEIEKSKDGKRFSMAALVLGTDRDGKETYQFFEKSASKKMFYRIKIINKDNSIEYSDVLIAKK
jgi:hypothetical protein